MAQPVEMLVRMPPDVHAEIDELARSAGLSHAMLLTQALARLQTSYRAHRRGRKVAFVAPDPPVVEEVTGFRGAPRPPNPSAETWPPRIAVVRPSTRPAPSSASRRRREHVESDGSGRDRDPFRARGVSCRARRASGTGAHAGGPRAPA